MIPAATSGGAGRR